MSALTLSHPWLEFDLGTPRQVLSWSLNRPGFVTTRRILWREVRNADLPRDFDVAAWLAGELIAARAEDAVCLLTSRNLDSFTQATVTIGATTAHCVATVGLSNAERVGYRLPPNPAAYGTINIAVSLTCALSQTGLIEAMSVATEARTAAVLEVGLRLPVGLATGTGTDCIAVAASDGGQDFAGLHTEIGEALGAAVFRATLEGARAWRPPVGPDLERSVKREIT